MMHLGDYMMVDLVYRGSFITARIDRRIAEIKGESFMLGDLPSQ